MIWAAFILLTAAMLVLVLAPLIRPRAGRAANAHPEIAVHKARLAELDRDLAQGQIESGEAQIARIEIQRRLLDIADSKQTPVCLISHKRVIAAVLLVLPLVAVGVYGMLGSPGMPDQPYSARADKIKAMQDQKAMFKGMVDNLAERLKSSPDDGRGWAMLGRSLKVLGEPGRARDAYAKALVLLPADVAVRLEYGQMLLDDQAADAPLPADFVAVMKDVLRLDPDNLDALYFVGTAEQQAGHKDAARAAWTRMLAKLPADSQDRAEITKLIDGLK